ncbi:hypothetical protein [Desulfotomaculum copahuensis]|uniref:Uncharacterized protein n=1 Tax=Desulfotomaculum copahuensis TaxID=1838280 RepID=A0A1B7LCM3_9FIRM|nr:hypothetical protein [Desulfotomaculum copahuensis]OAT80677.1 hypothetical protein A6M21_13160 [Desulfotomaculum copahuensis]
MKGQAFRRVGIFMAVGLAFAAGVLAGDRMHLLQSGLAGGFSVMPALKGLLGRYLHLAGALAISPALAVRRQGSREVRGP